MDIIESSKRDIADQFAQNVSFLVPIDRRNFDPISVSITLAGFLLGKFMYGFLKESGEQMQLLGEDFAKYTFKQFREKFLKPDEINPIIKEGFSIIKKVCSNNDPSVTLNYIQGGKKAVEYTLISENFPPHLSEYYSDFVTESSQKIISTIE
jgi:hypothetical protein